MATLPPKTQPIVMVYPGKELGAELNPHPTSYPANFDSGCLGIGEDSSVKIRYFNHLIDLAKFEG